MMMQRAGAIVYWFCAASAVVLILYGIWNVLAGREGRPVLILIFCVAMAAVFYIAGVWVRSTARRAAADT